MLKLWIHLTLWCGLRWSNRICIEWCKPCAVVRTVVFAPTLFSLFGCEPKAYGIYCHDMYTIFTWSIMSSHRHRSYFDMFMCCCLWQRVCDCVCVFCFDSANSNFYNIRYEISSRFNLEHRFCYRIVKIIEIMRGKPGSVGIEMIFGWTKPIGCYKISLPKSCSATNLLSNYICNFRDSKKKRKKKRILKSTSEPISRTGWKKIQIISEIGIVVWCLMRHEFS